MSETREPWIFGSLEINWPVQPIILKDRERRKQFKFDIYEIPIGSNLSLISAIAENQELSREKQPVGVEAMTAYVRKQRASWLKILKLLLVDPEKDYPVLANEDDGVSFQPLAEFITGLFDKMAPAEQDDLEKKTGPVLAVMGEPDLEGYD